MCLNNFLYAYNYVIMADEFRYSILKIYGISNVHYRFSIQSHFT